ncbi:F-box domain-containing protein [Colletotrichum abscissum]|uniref:F-box domain-containing protein n=1 Tax=Colletotrichum abscissum TaxID=1671311 RepID=A0A9P9X2C1_9PEZI|nr:F-box domain-containing protein [Colletotrichum abscissum]
MRLFRRFRSSTAFQAKHPLLLRKADQPDLCIQTSCDLPDAILQSVMRCVCPHAQDDTYETCETSAALGACALCDLRDLAHCARVCKRWYNLATGILYQSIRIDAVHYCPLEAHLSEQRKHRGFLRSNADPDDVLTARLGLLRRTLCDNEVAGPDLFRIVHMLPNIRYVDLPSGLFADQSRYGTLRLAIEARCRDLRKMIYRGGAETALTGMATANTWRNLEVLELIKIEMATCVLRHALGTLGNLRALKIEGVRSFSDVSLGHIDGSSPFPCLEELVLRSTPAVTGSGLLEYLCRSDTRNTITVLALLGTGVPTGSLVDALAAAPNLRTLAIEATVSRPLRDGAIAQRLASTSLRKLRFELTTADSKGFGSWTIASHYRYLAAALMANDLPHLTSVYVLDEHLLHQLGLPYPRLASTSTCHASVLDPASTDETARCRVKSFPKDVASRDLPSSPSVALRQQLTLYTRTADAADWPSAGVQSPVRGCDQLVSQYGLNADIAGCGWGHHQAVRRWVLARDQQGVIKCLSNLANYGHTDGPETNDWPRTQDNGADLWR